MWMMINVENKQYLVLKLRLYLLVNTTSMLLYNIFSHYSHNTLKSWKSLVKRCGNPVEYNYCVLVMGVINIFTYATEIPSHWLLLGLYSKHLKVII